MRKANVVAPRRWWINGSERLFDLTLKSYGIFGVGLIADMDPNASGDMGVVAKQVDTETQLVITAASKIVRSLGDRSQRGRRHCELSVEHAIDESRIAPNPDLRRGQPL